MTFFITLGFMIVTLYLQIRYREQISAKFLSLFRYPTRAALFAALIFSILEEGALNFFSGTLVVLIATVPPLVFFVYVFGKLGQMWNAKSIKYPLILLIVFGIVFEYTVGGHSKNFQSGGLGPQVLFGFFLGAITYTYTALIGLTILIKNKPLTPPTAVRKFVKTFIIIGLLVLLFIQMNAINKRSNEHARSEPVSSERN